MSAVSPAQYWIAKANQSWLKPTGEIAPAYTFNALGALKGYELLGKHLKLWTEKVEQIGSDGKPLDAVKVILIGAKGRCLERPSHPTSSST
ncbi:MAG TPA: hypothetical protein VK579_01120 [Terriglobales bacterium]|nr:hypothetical protein [Terriglobales bacterium]